MHDGKGKGVAILDSKEAQRKAFQVNQIAMF